MEPLVLKRRGDGMAGSQMLMQSVAHAEARERAAALVAEQGRGGRILIGVWQLTVDQLAEQPRGVWPDWTQTELAALAVEANLVGRVETDVAYAQIENLLDAGAGIEQKPNKA